MGFGDRWLNAPAATTLEKAARDAKWTHVAGLILVGGGMFMLLSGLALNVGTSSGRILSLGDLVLVAVSILAVIQGLLLRHQAEHKREAWRRMAASNGSSSP